MKTTGSKIAIAAGFSLLALAMAQAGDVTEGRDLRAFEKIIIDGVGIELDVDVGKDFSVLLKGSEKWLGRITTKVEDNTLVIARKDGKKNIFNFDSDNLVIITMPKFLALEVNGAVDADISGVDSENLLFGINGAGNIEVDGICGQLTVELNGAANFEGEDLKCEDIKISINGAGNVETYASKSADLDINGVGNIDLYGNPKVITQDKSWFSNIEIHVK
ncbi:MAG: DUF2807 domain-containing protein [Emcibacter sp.]|nr:DUF2807 domain-containing protein [Emcibacter sp.]